MDVESSEMEKTASASHMTRERSLPDLPLPHPPPSDEYDQQNSTSLTSAPGEEELYEEIQTEDKDVGTNPESQSVSIRAHKKERKEGERGEGFEHCFP